MEQLAQADKFQKAEDFTEEAKRAAREAHLKAEEALHKQAEAQASLLSVAFSI